MSVQEIEMSVKEIEMSVNEIEMSMNVGESDHDIEMCVGHTIDTGDQADT
jgi:hypothetical protein